MKHIKWLLLIVFVALAVIVISQNMPQFLIPVSFKINLWFVEYFTPDMPLGVIMVVAFLVGALFLAVCGIVERFRLKKEIKVLSAENRAMDKELGTYKTPLVSTEVVNLE